MMATSNSLAGALNLLVVSQSNTNLAFHNWVVPISLVNVFDSNINHSLHNLSTSHLTLDVLLEKFKEIFSPELRLVKGIKVHLTCMKDTVPKFFKACFVPYAYKEKNDKEIDQFVADSILEHVKTSDWAALIVPVFK